MWRLGRRAQCDDRRRVQSIVWLRSWTPDGAALAFDSSAGEWKERWSRSARRGAVSMRQGPECSGREAPGSSIHGKNVGPVVPHLRGAFCRRVLSEKKSVLWYHTWARDRNNFEKSRSWGTTLPIGAMSFSKKVGPVVPHFRGGEYLSKKSRSCGTTLPWREYSSKKSQSSGTTRFWEYLYSIRALPGQPKISTGVPHCPGITSFRCRLSARETLDQGGKRRRFFR